MVCYIVPSIAAISIYFLKTSLHSWKDNIYYNWYYYLLLGGAVFGLVDHLWNGELLLLSENLLLDIILGIIITVSISIVWAFIVYIDKTKTEKPNRLLQ
jgi:hypothetical protein